MIDRYLSPAEFRRLMSALLVVAGFICIAALFGFLIVPGLLGANKPAAEVAHEGEAGGPRARAGEEPGLVADPRPGGARAPDTCDERDERFDGGDEDPVASGNAEELQQGRIDAAFIIGTGIALWFATANPFLAQIANLPK